LVLTQERAEKQVKEENLRIQETPLLLGLHSLHNQWLCRVAFSLDHLGRKRFFLPWVLTQRKMVGELIFRKETKKKGKRLEVEVETHCKPSSEPTCFLSKIWVLFLKFCLGNRAIEDDIIQLNLSFKLFQ